MFRISRLGRLAAAAVLVASGASLAIAAPAGAANTSANFDCVSQYTYFTLENSDTLTLTMAGSCSGFIILNMPQGGALGTATLNGFPMTAGSPVGFSLGDTVVYTAPASGSGTDGFGIMPSLQQPPGPQISITFPAPTPRNDSLVDNGNGSMTVTFDPVTGMEEVFLGIFPSGTTCSPFGSPTGRLYVLSTSPQLPVQMTSPTILAAGSTAYISGIDGRVTGLSKIAAGSYQACLYFRSSMSELVQSLAITFSEVTTSTTASGTDPVTPAFTG
jgi:hypothetical protein